jgi:hypothetical protein
MMLMIGNHASCYFGYLMGKYPGRLGWLLGPTHYNRPRQWLPFALDNDAFVLRDKWQESDWLEMLNKVRMSGQNPAWVLIPDSVGNRQRTLSLWQQYAPQASRYGWPLAFAVQDGMTAADVPHDTDVVFVGGTTRWKWQSLPMWASNFPRVHVGRVNQLRRLWTCEEYAVESVDGTGWMREGDDGKRMRPMLRWLAGERNETPELPLALMRPNAPHERRAGNDA